MRPSFIANVSVLLLCTSLAYWSGWQQGAGGNVSASGPNVSKRAMRERRPQGAETELVKRTVAELVAEVRKGANGKEDATYTEAWEELIERDPEKAWELLILKGDRAEYFEHSDSILMNLAGAKPRLAQELVLKLTNSSQRAAALAIVLDVWARREPKEALSSALSHPESRRPQVLNDLARIWGESAPAEAAAFAATLEHGALRRGFLEGLSNSWISQDLDGFCAWFKGLEPRDSRSLVGKLSGNFDSDNPKSLGSIQLLWNTLPPGEPRDSLVSSLVHPLKLEKIEDFAANLAGIEALGDAKLSELLRARLLERYAEEEPAQAASFLGQVKPEEKQALLGSLAFSWAGKDPEAARAWVEALPQGEEKNLAMSSLIRGMVQENAAEALALFLAHPETAEVPYPENALEVLAESYLDPSELLKAIPLVKDAEKQNDVLNNLSRRWAGEDLHGCVEWIETLPAGGTRDQAVTGLVSAISEEDGKTAVAWALTVSDPEMRQETVQNSIVDWWRHSPDEAEGWLDKNQAQLSKETRSFVRSIIRHARSGGTTNGFAAPGPEAEQP